MKTKFYKRKKLDHRCPYCGASQIWKRKLVGDYKCRCGKVFKVPKKDE